MGHAKCIQCIQNPVICSSARAKVSCDVLLYSKKLTTIGREWALPDFTASVALAICFHIPELAFSAQSRKIISSLS